MGRRKGDGETARHLPLEKRGKGVYFGKSDSLVIGGQGVEEGGGRGE